MGADYDKTLVDVECTKGVLINITMKKSDIFSKEKCLWTQRYRCNGRFGCDKVTLKNGRKMCDGMTVDAS